ncbi:hypothetical protein [Pedobacter panaciterrae]|uniref:hypothetical protein n=1 Tax=Pedobacter panaciterrae TaxID=363849 RepID=UPI003F68BD18
MMLSALILLSLNAYPQTSLLLNKEVLKKVKAIMAADEWLIGVFVSVAIQRTTKNLADA